MSVLVDSHWRSHPQTTLMNRGHQQPSHSQPPHAPSKNTVSLTRDILITVLNYMSTLIPTEFSGKPLRLIVHGGACMLLHPDLHKLALQSDFSSQALGATEPPIPRRQATRDVDYIHRAFMKEYTAMGFLNPAERLQRCIQKTAAHFGLGADWMNSDADIALPTSINPGNGTLDDPIHDASITPNNIEVHTVYMSENRMLQLISVPPFWALSLKLVRYTGYDPGDICNILRNGTATRGITWNAQRIEQWLFNSCQAMGYAYYDPARLSQVRARIVHAVETLKKASNGAAIHHDEELSDSFNSFSLNGGPFAPPAAQSPPSRMMSPGWSGPGMDPKPPPLSLPHHPYIPPSHPSSPPMMGDGGSLWMNQHQQPQHQFNSIPPHQSWMGSPPQHALFIPPHANASSAFYHRNSNSLHHNNEPPFIPPARHLTDSSLANRIAESYDQGHEFGRRHKTMPTIGANGALPSKSSPVSRHHKQKSRDEKLVIKEKRRKKRESDRGRDMARRVKYMLGWKEPDDSDDDGDTDPASEGDSDSEDERAARSRWLKKSSTAKPAKSSSLSRHEQLRRSSGEAQSSGHRSRHSHIRDNEAGSRTEPPPSLKGLPWLTPASHDPPSLNASRSNLNRIYSSPQHQSNNEEFRSNYSSPYIMVDPRPLPVEPPVVPQYSDAGDESEWDDRPPHMRSRSRGRGQAGAAGGESMRRQPSIGKMRHQSHASDGAAVIAQQQRQHQLYYEPTIVTQYRQQQQYQQRQQQEHSQSGLQPKHRTSSRHPPPGAMQQYYSSEPRGNALGLEL